MIVKLVAIGNNVLVPKRNPVYLNSDRKSYMKLYRRHGYAKLLLNLNSAMPNELE